SPSQIDIARKVSGGNALMPSFITGQLTPHTSVRRTRRTSCWRLSLCMGRHCGRWSAMARSLQSGFMTFVQMLQGAQARNGSMLCVGLDPEPGRFPAALRGDVSRIHEFCARIVDATADLVIAFKPQIAYFAAYRAEAQLER